MANSSYFSFRFPGDPDDASYPCNLPSFCSPSVSFVGMVGGHWDDPRGHRTFAVAVTAYVGRFPNGSCNYATYNIAVDLSATEHWKNVPMPTKGRFLQVYGDVIGIYAGPRREMLCVVANSLNFLPSPEALSLALRPLPQPRPPLQRRPQADAVS